MAKTFDIAAMTAEDTVTINLPDGNTLRSRTLFPEVIDELSGLIDRGAREDIQEEVTQRKLIRTLQDDATDDNAYAETSNELTELTNRSARRGRRFTYAQLAVVLVTGEDGEPVSPEYLESQIPYPEARRITREFTRQILGQADGGSGNAAGSDGAPTPTATTS